MTIPMILHRPSVRLLPAIVLMVAVILPTLAAAQNCPICQYCGKAISGRYYVSEGRFYHAECFEEHVAPRCGVCNEPLLGEYVVYEGIPYHQSCYERTAALRCSVCGGIINGEYLLDPWGKPFHKEHADDIPMCRFCGRLITDPDAGGGKKFDDQYYICNHCRQDVISDPAVAERMVNNIRLQLKDLGIDLGKAEIDFVLADREMLSRENGEFDIDNYGLARYRTSDFLFGLMHDEDYAVFVLTGLPRMYFIATAAHELMHIWIYINGADEMVPQMVEGSCEMAALLILDNYDDVMIPLVSSQIEQNPNETYGEGCRRVKKMVENRGVPYWLEHLQFDPDFPIGY